MPVSSIVVLWVFLVPGNWSTYDTYDSLAECKGAQARLHARQDAGKLRIPLVNSICLPPCQEPR